MIMEAGWQVQVQYRVTPEVYKGFLEISQDHNPLHTQSEYAQSRGFKAQVMHGNILGVFLSHFVGEGLPMKNTVILSQNIKYRSPVYLDDTLNFQAVLAAFHESVTMYDFKYKFANGETLIANGTIQVGLLS